MNNYPLVLMYHGIKTNSLLVPEKREIGAELYDVYLKKFVSQMLWLRENNYQTVFVDEINVFDQEKQVILTFDDGELNNFIHALPILKALNFKAYFFIIVDRIGKPGYMGWDELHQLDEAGMIIGSHSLTHPILTNLVTQQVERELYDSLTCLLNHFGDQIDTFSIPRGFYNDEIIRIAHKVGYKHVFASEKNINLKEKCWERTAIKSSWNIHRFEQAMKGEKPVYEKSFDQTKKILKKIFKGKIYDDLRSTVINLTQP